MQHEVSPHAGLGHLLSSMVEPDWYLDQNPDIAAMNLDPVAHFREFGPFDRRDPNRFFDCRWYAARYPEVAASGLDPIIHYLRSGAAALLDPHPRFDAAWYVQQHPDAALNPVLYHLQIGRVCGFATEKPVDIDDFLPSAMSPPNPPSGVFVDIIVPMFSDLGAAQRCLTGMLAGRTFPIARVIVFDHTGSDSALSAWLDVLAADGEIHLIRERRGLGYAACALRGIEAAEAHDVVLLDNNTQVSADSLRRLAGYAWSAPRVATVCASSDDTSCPEYGISTFGYPASELEEICREVNSGRSVQIPSATGACIYIRRDALRAVGGLRSGPDPAADFCRRASVGGWQHRLACDVFAAARHDDRVRPAMARKLSSFASDNERIRPTGTADRFRFAVSAALFRRSGLPVVLMVSHDLGGGIRRHINGLAERYMGRAHVLLLAGEDRGAAVSLPLQPNHPVAILPPDRLDQIVELLRSAGVTRVHIHHMLNQAVDVRRLIHRLDVPFDVTVHDYYTICPQVNLLRWPEGLYCQEPDRAGCNRCIAEFSSYHAKEILCWRGEQVWQFIEADRVICPSEDVRLRLSRYGAGSNALVAPHERHPGGDWPVTLPGGTGSPLRVVLLGVLANHKGARIVASVAEAASPGSLEIHLIGHLEPSFPKPAVRFIRATGKYQEEQLDALLNEARPQVFWFPSTAAETYSYTLTKAIESGLPIVATNLGSFPERLAGRPNTWLLEYNAPTQDWLAAFDDVRKRLSDPRPQVGVARPAPASDFYEKHYLVPATVRAKAAGGTKPRIAVLPERSENGALTDSAYIRLLQPLDHPAIGGAFDVLFVDTETVFDSGADIVVTQRDAISDPETADRLGAYVRRTGGTLIFDLDDDLLSSEAKPRSRAEAIRRMLSIADAIWLSTKDLAGRLSAIRPDAIVLEDRLDERIWTTPSPPTAYWDDPVRFLYLRADKGDADLAMIEPTLTRLKGEYGDRISIDVLAAVRPLDLPRELNGIGPSANGGRSYPGFVDWMIRSRPGWHIGLAPLTDTALSRYRSPAKALSYAAMGLATLASDVPPHRGSIADGPGGQLVPNDPVAWYTALDWLIRDQDLRRRLGRQARAAFMERGSLASAAVERSAALQSLLAARRLRDGSVALTISHDQSHPAPRTRRRSGRGR